MEDQAMDSPKSPDQELTTPFLLKLFYRTGAFHRPDEFSSLTTLPHLQIHTYETCTLLELTHHLAASIPTSLPSPAIGTRLSFRLIYQNTSIPSGSSSTIPPPRFISKDLGSLVIGENGPGVAVDQSPDMPEPEQAEPSAATKTLADAKFVVGDYLSCAILPPIAGTGAVASGIGAKAEATVSGRRLSTGTGGGGAPLPGRRDNGVYVAGPRGRGRGGRGGREWERDRDERDRGFGHVPDGEWRRGEKLPDAAPRGGRRGGSRW